MYMYNVNLVEENKIKKKKNQGWVFIEFFEFRSV